MIISIDPGLTGAISYFDENHGFICTEDMPVSEKTSGKGKQISATLLNDLIADEGITKAIVERVHSMPKQGVTGVFGFGRSLGVIEGILAGNGIPIEWITPQQWKKKFGLIGKHKDSARTMVLEMYPQHITWFKHKKDIGRADSVLIGLASINK